MSQNFLAAPLWTSLIISVNLVVKLVLSRSVKRIATLLGPLLRSAWRLHEWTARNEYKF